MGPGDKAHATKVRNALRRKFGGEAKAIVRKECVAYLKASGAKHPLVLWGGGLDAELCRAVGMEPIVVDDGSAADLLGITKASFRKAFLTSCEVEGFDARWGPAERYAAEADSAILDFCSHWSSGVRRSSHSCKHMVAIAATLMPSRVAVGSLTPREWKVIHRALLKDATGLTPTITRLYTRNEHGDRAMVVMLRRQYNGIRSPLVRERLREYFRTYSQRPEQRERQHEYWRKRYADPAAREQIRARARESYQRNREKIRATAKARRQTPESIAKRAEAQRAYRAKKAAIGPASPA